MDVTRKPCIAVASLGGTIAMTSDTRDGVGIRPTLGVMDLVEAVPALADIADLRSATLSTVPGASLGFADVRGALDWARSEIRDGAEGVVLTQGTDTIEETAYLLDLYWDLSEPLIVTGAMRSPHTPGADGPANLLAAVIVAADPRSHDRGVLVVMNDEVHAASRVRKMRTSGVHAFVSPSFGPLGYLEERRIVYGSKPARRPCLPSPVPRSPARVAMVEVGLGDEGELLDLAVAAGLDGIVVAGYGVGHVSEPFAESLDRAVVACPVILASRTGSGTVFRQTYNFIGSETDLLSRGAISSGWLDGRKARILLCCLLAEGYTRKEISGEFSLRGCGSAEPITEPEPSEESTDNVKSF